MFAKTLSPTLFIPPDVEPQWFVFYKGDLLVNRGQVPGLPSKMRPEDLGIDPGRAILVGHWQRHPCLAVDANTADLPKQFQFKPLRKLYRDFDEPLFWLAARAGHYLYWHLNHQYCGSCGKALDFHRRERAKKCSSCKTIFYPRISPAIIVAVVKNRRLLLARSRNFPKKMMSVLAGFVEPGETLEASVHREVQEEVGIEIDHVRYFGSQPWPFPDSLMIAFTARYARGQLCFTDGEIQEAAWYAASELPQIPPRRSIARHLIEWFIETYR